MKSRSVVLPSASVPGAKRPTAILMNRSWLLVGAIALFLLFVAGASWYYWRQATETTTPVVIKNPPPITIETSTAPVVISPPPTTAEVVQPIITSTPPTLASEDGPLSFPPTFVPDSNDNDRDGLTNAEEELFKSDLEVPDTDHDGYQDGLEVYYLYSPTNAAPAKLIDSGVVKTFTNPAFGYQLYYPATWAQASVDMGYRDILLSTITGENVELRAVVATSTFANWFSAWAPSERFENLQPFTTRYGVTGYMRSDKLVYYFPVTGRVYVLLYHPELNSAINYRSVIGMIARSFQPSEITTHIPGKELEEISDALGTTTTQSRVTSTGI